MGYDDKEMGWDGVTLSLSYLPGHQFEEHHDIVVYRPPTIVLDAVESIDPAEDALIGALIGLRQLPHRMFGSKVEGVSPFGLRNFTRLERSDRHLAYGLVGRFWRLDFGLEPIADGQTFLAFAEPGVAKLVLSFDAQALGEGGTRLTTRTRVFCPDRATRRRMLPYWTIIRPASGFIRGRMLRQVKRRAEGAPATL